VTFPRQEIEAAFAEFRKRGTVEHDWAGWADLFTDDATYVEHNLGTMLGRQQIKDFIVGCMDEYGAMTFDIEWSMIDDDRVVFYIWNLLPDPTGGGTEYKFPNTTVLQYAGGGKWKFEEDFYNPAMATEVFTSWLEAGGRKDTSPDHSLRGIAGFCPEPRPGPFPREEVEAEFHRYEERARLAVASGDWAQWAVQFTEDARYFEHHYGKMEGREAIRSWITSVMRPFPEMEFPTEWYVIDGNRVSFLAPNRLPDPAGGDTRFEFRVNVILHYAGGGKWSYEEDVYNPEEAPKVIKEWLEAGGRFPDGAELPEGIA
jgi:ketosteroid isomerase-like protein